MFKYSDHFIFLSKHILLLVIMFPVHTNSIHIFHGDNIIKL